MIDVGAKRKKVKGLIELALDEGATREERTNAAMRAVKIIDKYDLLTGPLDGLLGGGNDTLKAAATVVETVTAPGFLDSLKHLGGQVSRARAGRRR